MFPWEKLDWTAVGTGVLFTVAVLFQATKGFVVGRNDAPVPPQPGVPPPTTVEVAGALIDTKRIDLLIAELGSLTAVLVTVRKIMEEHGQRIDVNSGRIEVSNKVIERTGEHMERLTREIVDLKDETKDLRDEMLRGGRPR